MAQAMAEGDDEDDKEDDEEGDEDGEHEWGTRSNSPNQRHICPLSPLIVVHDSASQYPAQLVFGMGRCHSATLRHMLRYPLRYTILYCTLVRSHLRFGTDGKDGSGWMIGHT